MSHTYPSHPLVFREPKHTLFLGACDTPDVIITSPIREVLLSFDVLFRGGGKKNLMFFPSQMSLIIPSTIYIIIYRTIDVRWEVVPSRPSVFREPTPSFLRACDTSDVIITSSPIRVASFW